ncbi:MAG TPA: DUF3011 domain-containing protein [Gemmatimonadales bacterium]|nr:DUF3011 domain-containing protein [Gemmatimonadales bacterium]
MRRHVLRLVAGSIVALAALVAVPHASAQTGTVRCESRGSDREQCAIERGARVELARHLSQTPCQQNQNWGVGQGFIWVSGGCRADFQVTALSAYPSPSTDPGNARATPLQLRTCRIEADRRMPSYSYEQIQVEGQSRQGSTAVVRWQAGNSGGTCTVAANGQILRFTTGGAGEDGMTGTTRITCESKRSDRQECPIPAGAQVRLVRQISTQPCRMNDTFGLGDGYLWVAEGCRGEFEVSRAGMPTDPGAGGGTTQMQCGSSKNFREECPIPAGATARLVRQTSQAACTLNQSYGIGANAIWVSRGCRAVFEVTRGGFSGGNGGGSTTRMTCESQGAARQQCAVAGASRIRLVRQLSTSPCTLNTSYGTGSGHIWVSNGCRGEFDVTVQGGQTGGQPDGSGLPANSGLGERITCESKGNDRTECPIRNGAQVRLVRQLSTTACTLNYTYGASNGVLWVTRGCRGEFEVR